MGEILRARINSLYGDLKGLLSQIPSIKERSLVSPFIVDQINDVFDNLTNISKSDFSMYKIPVSQINTDWNEYPSTIVRAQLGRAISRLEQEYGFNEDKKNGNSIVIMNKNENEIELSINYTIKELALKETDVNAKEQLLDLDKELKKSDKNWENIKKILIWILNFSKELFLEIIPIILKSKI